MAKEIGGSYNFVSIGTPKLPYRFLRIFAVTAAGKFMGALDTNKDIVPITGTYDKSGGTLEFVTASHTGGILSATHFTGTAKFSGGTPSLSGDWSKYVYKLVRLGKVTITKIGGEWGARYTGPVIR